MITVEQAISRLMDMAPTPGTETVGLELALGRTLSASVIARLSQPPERMSAMDGYALRFEELESTNSFILVGESAAGSPFSGTVDIGQCVRVFTGSVIPDGCNHVVIQEDVDRRGDQVSVTSTYSAPGNIRAAGIDFKSGEVLQETGQLIDAFTLTAIAAANIAEVTVATRPVVGVIANGDELRMPGDAELVSDIVCSTQFGLSGLIADWGADYRFLGIARDDPAHIQDIIASGSKCDVLVTLGGASVGDHDHMRRTFAEAGFEERFSKVAVKPGKPTWAGLLKQQPVLGLPGNPASALVCAHLILKPLIFKMTGRDPDAAQRITYARLSHGVRANGPRDAFQRAKRSVDNEGQCWVELMPSQDSSLITPFLRSNVLVRLPSNSPAKEAGQLVECYDLA